jgi:hypothetical protein
MRLESVTTKDGYCIHIVHPPSRKGIISRVDLAGIFVAEQSGFLTHTQAARWARSQIRDHRRAHRILRRT